jgi:hypothetical protein
MPDRMTLVHRLAAALTAVVVLVVVGALAGVVWWWVWTPPTGVVLDERWVLDAQGLARDFDGTAWYVVVASVAGLVGGLVVTWRTRSEEVTVLAAVVVGAVLAGWVMYQVGHALGPADPQVLAQGRADLTALPGDLRVAGADPDPSPVGRGASVFLAFPAGALSAAAAVFLMTERRGRASAVRPLR